MADRADFYFRQRVTEAELDLAFSLLEEADRSLVADLSIHGVISGAIPAPHSPVPNLTVDLTAPARAYDSLGQRLFYGTGQTVDCAVDLVGLPTDVAAAGNERWLGIFLRFRRQLSDPRTDGNSQQVFFRRDESFELVIRQAPEGAAGAAPKPVLQTDELLLCDVRRRHGQTQIVAGDIDTTRRQAFIFAQGTAVGVETGTWSILTPLAATAQASLDAVDAELRDHFTASARRHTAAAIDFTPHGFVGAGTVQSAIAEVVDDLASIAAGSSGASRIGVDASPGTPHSITGGTVKGHLASILGFLNAHRNAASAAHAASAIGATAHNHIAATNVQAQLQETVTDLMSTGAAAPGAGLVGVDAIPGTPSAIAAGTLRAALASLLSGHNEHVNQSTGAHAASTVSVADAGNQLSAAHVEGALAEILEAYAADHFRGIDPTPGLHRTIRQPNLGGSKALIWDSLGNGSAGARLRVYLDAEAVWFTLNASWNGTGWSRDDTTLFCSSFRMGRSQIEFLHDRSLTPTFTGWQSTWRIPVTSTVNSAFELFGAIQETGRLGVRVSNTSDTPQGVSTGGDVTFRNRFSASPSSVTLSAIDAVVSTPTVFLANRDGFAYATTVNVTGRSTIYWHGSYTAIA